MLSRRKTALEYARDSQSSEPRANAYEDPAAILAKQEEQKAVWRILEALDPEIREILCLKYIQGNSYQEISQLLQVPRGTVMSRLFHARKAFRMQYLENEAAVRQQRGR
jgi:RNA polymerase sigma factor (sigma-70 family)